MLWILTGIGVLLLAFGIFLLFVKSEDEEVAITIFAVGIVVSLIFGIILCCVLQSRHSTIYNSRNQIKVLEENNNTLLSEISPIIERYLDYESGTSAKMKVDGNTLIAYSMYPELKGNEFVMKQIEIIEANNREIKNKKLSLAGLESYRIWLFMGSPREMLE